MSLPDEDASTGNLQGSLRKRESCTDVMARPYTCVPPARPDGAILVCHVDNRDGAAEDAVSRAAVTASGNVWKEPRPPSDGG
jgi:hypothetical protein